MAVQFLPQQSQSGNILSQLYASGKNVWWAQYGGGNTIQIALSTDQAKTWGSFNTIDSTAGNNDLMLNDPIALDPVTGRLHVLYGRQTNTVGVSPTLLHKYSDDPTLVTWSSEHTIDNQNRGNKRFFRVGIVAYNNNVTIWYVSIDDTVFTTDGFLWMNRSSDGGSTWTGPTKMYTSSVVMATEPNVRTDEANGQYAVVSWYDPGVVANNTGPLYCSVTKDGGATWSANSILAATGPAGGYGRPRPAIRNGTILIAAQGWSAQSSSGGKQDLEIIRSNDLGNTWQTPVQIINYANISGVTVSHPDIKFVGDHVFLFYSDITQNNPPSQPAAYGYLQSDDDGATFGGISAPLTTTGGGDAPKLMDTDDYLIARGFDTQANKTIWTRLPIFAAQPGTIDLLDNFTRANEDPLSQGGNWTTGFTSTTPLKIVSDAAQREEPSGTFRRDGAQYTARTVAANEPQGVMALVDQIVSPGAAGVAGLVGIRNQSLNSHYAVNLIDNGAGAAFTLVKVVSGTQTSIGTSAFIAQNGDQLELQIDGSDVIVWLIRGGNVYEALRVNDTSVRDAFNGGLEIVATNDTTPWRFGNFGHAQLVVPSSTVAPSITGTVLNGNKLSVSSNGTWSPNNGGTPQRWSYQWQTSPDGLTWSNVTGATLAFFVVTDQTKYHRAVVTGTNTIGPGSANSNALVPSAGPPGICLPTTLRIVSYGSGLKVVEYDSGLRIDQC